MTSFKFSVLDPVKIPLVKKIYKSHYPAGKPKSDERIIIATQESQTVAVVRLKTVEQQRLMTGMLVIPACRGLGIAHQLMQHLKQNELTDNDYCFALAHLEGFYNQHGFQHIDTEALPNTLKQLFSRYTGSGKALVAMRYHDRD
ncbi:GNAT family N-acetyltransferase [Vibrio hippocampi]|uniref:N-acetyltransferase domain-containing protein n=1 Tax=Vibrio hippocampi TaxID=654686 RepID=A0ABM8ZK74_9VIBR|nr:GNAT family N-acetyltransferase [Vibrio hippocampi]CAH0527306.1 hypothetical protein VHP8226_02640 [Vibrio hippocampi]